MNQIREEGNRTTLVIYKETLKDLKHIARKDQTYDQLIKELIKMRLKIPEVTAV